MLQKAGFKENPAIPPDLKMWHESLQCTPHQITLATIESESTLGMIHIQ